MAKITAFMSDNNDDNDVDNNDTDNNDNCYYHAYNLVIIYNKKQLLSLFLRYFRYS